MRLHGNDRRARRGTRHIADRSGGRSGGRRTCDVGVVGHPGRAGPSGVRHVLITLPCPQDVCRLAGYGADEARCSAREVEGASGHADGCADGPAGHGAGQSDRRAGKAEDALGHGDGVRCLEWVHVSQPSLVENGLVPVSIALKRDRRSMSPGIAGRCW